jgi:hypothetical protein
MIRPFLIDQLGRARSSMPAIYGDRLAQVELVPLRSPSDWWQIPLLFKDDGPGPDTIKDFKRYPDPGPDSNKDQKRYPDPAPDMYKDTKANRRGFRPIAAQDPFALKPQDPVASASAVFGSGGSQGRQTPTFVTLADRAREVQAWRRSLDYHGLGPGDTVLYTYNTTHKGGQWMQESLWEHGINVILRRPEEGPEQVLQNLRAYHANALFTVQQPGGSLPRQEKAAGINLHSLLQASLEDPKYRGILLNDSTGSRQIQFLFLGGFEIVPYALELIHEYLDDIPVATMLGSSEAIPQACSTNPALTPGAHCHHNNLHLLAGPHYIEVVKPEGDRWVPVATGEEGWLVYTSWARDGTIWIRYAPGDLATWTLDEGQCSCGIYSPVISNVHRADAQEQADLFLHGCAAG